MVVEALRNVNLHLREGDRVGLVGHNGAGKSTLLRLLSGIYEPTRGSRTSMVGSHRCSILVWVWTRKSPGMRTSLSAGYSSARPGNK